MYVLVVYTLECQYTKVGKKRHFWKKGRNNSCVLFYSFNWFRFLPWHSLLLILQMLMNVPLTLVKKRKFASTAMEASLVWHNPPWTQTNVLTRHVQKIPRVSTPQEVTSVFHQVRNCISIGITQNVELFWIKLFIATLDIPELCIKNYAIETYIYTM